MKSINQYLVNRHLNKLDDKCVVSDCLITSENKKIKENSIVKFRIDGFGEYICKVKEITDSSLYTYYSINKFNPENHYNCCLNARWPKKNPINSESVIYEFSDDDIDRINQSEELRNNYKEDDLTKVVTLK